MYIEMERVIHSLKTALGCIVGFLLIKLFHSYLFFDQWLIVTIIVVMCAQISVGSIVYKSIIRFIGTCIGSLFAVFALVTFGDHAPLAFAGVIALAGLVFSYVATSGQSYSDAGTLGAVTTAIILINPHPTLSLTAERFFEITLGIIIATLISQFILPIHARKHLRRNQAQTLHLLCAYYLHATTIPPLDEEKITELDEGIVQLLMTQRKLAKDAKQELLGSKFEPEDFKQWMTCEKRILRSIDFLNRTYHKVNLHDILQNNSAWDQFNKKTVVVFGEIANQIENPVTLPPPIITPSVAILREEILQHTDPHAKEPPHPYAFFFCLENIMAQLTELAALIR